MKKMLTPEQQAKFEENLAQQDGIPADEGGELSSDAKQQALNEGAAMAKADEENTTAPGADTPGQQEPTQQAPDPDAQMLQELGFESVSQLVDAFRRVAASEIQMKDTLTQMLALQKAQQNEEELDPNDPSYTVKKAIREEMAPLYEKMKDDTRNRLVRDAWGKSAAGMSDLNDFMPDISEIFKANPDLAVSEDGLQRAYDSVRSKKYRSKEQLLDDPEFIKEAAKNDKIKNAVLEAHLGEIARNGDVIPASIDEGGGVPLTGKKKSVSGLDQAKSQLLKILGSK